MMKACECLEKGVDNWLQAEESDEGDFTTSHYQWSDNSYCSKKQYGVEKYLG